MSELSAQHPATSCVTILHPILSWVCYCAPNMLMDIVKISDTILRIKHNSCTALFQARRQSTAASCRYMNTVSPEHMHRAVYVMNAAATHLVSGFIDFQHRVQLPVMSICVSALQPWAAAFQLSCYLLCYMLQDTACRCFHSDSMDRFMRLKKSMRQQCEFSMVDGAPGGHQFRCAPWQSDSISAVACCAWKAASMVTHQTNSLTYVDVHEAGYDIDHHEKQTTPISSTNNLTF